MNPDIEIDQRTEEITKILLRLTHIYSELKYLNLPNNNRVLYFIRNYSVLNFSKYTFLVSTIMDLNTLLNRTQKLSIIKLLEFAKKHFHEINWKNKITVDEVNGWINTLKSKESQINKLKTLRDKYYAHVDRNQVAVEEIMLPFSEFDELINIVSEIFRRFIISNTGDDILLAPEIDQTGSEHLLRSLVNLDNIYKEEENNINKSKQ